jgi:hypothetical protein
VHLALAALVLWRGAELLGPGAGGAGPRGGGGGTGGERAVTWFNLPPPSTPRMLDVPAAPVIVVPTVVLPDPVKLDVTPVSLTPDPTPAQPEPVVATSQTGTGGQGPGTGGGQGTGTGPGTGAAAGPGSGGEGGYIFPAVAKGVILPAECARGEFQVRFWVEANGRVSRVDVVPPPKDAGCRREMMERMRAYQFRPATTRDGQPVASIFQIRLVH